MKRILILLALCLLPLTALAQKAISQQDIANLVEQYSATEGFDVMKMNNMSTSLIKTALKVAAKNNSDDSYINDILDVLKGIKKITVIDFSECSLSSRTAIKESITKLLSGADLIVEMKEGLDRTQMYGVVSESGSTVKDFILYSSDDCSLSCLFGTISLDAINKIAR